MAKRNPPGGTKAGGLGLVPPLEGSIDGGIAVLGDDTPLDDGIVAGIRELGAGEAGEERENPETTEFQDPGPHYASESPFAAPPEAHREAGKNKKGGRPPNPVAENPGQVIHVPTPKFSNYKWDATNPAQRTKALWNWWNALHPSQKDQLQAYVYRDWPVLKLAPGQEVSEVGANPNMDKISGSEAIQDDVDFLHRYGVGVYRLRLNKVTRDGSSGTITTAYIGGLGNDMKSNPPNDKRISDIAQVDLGHPENGSYVAFLRMAGKLPDENREEDMAQVAQVTEMAGLVGKLIDDRNSKASESQVASTKAMEVVAEGAKAAIKITQDANDYAARQRETADKERAAREAEVRAASVSPVPQAPAESPLKLAIEILQLMQTNKGSDDILSKFMEQSNKQMERMEKLFTDSLNRPQAQPTPIVDRIKDLKDLREISEDLFGPPAGRESNTMADGVADVAGDAAPKWLRPYVPILVPVLTSVIQGFMQRGPVPGPMPVPQPGPVQYPPQALPYPQAPVQFPGQPPMPQPIPQTANPGAAAPQPQPGGLPIQDPQIQALLNMISVPFLTMIQDPSMTGTDFAGWFTDGFSMTVHNQVISYGPDALFQAIASYAPIANELAAMRMPEKRVREFIGEFCDPKWENEGGKEDGKDGKAPGNGGTDPGSTPPAS